ncbi:MAG: pantetheine-phosphate adenylyltransferase [Candidatus Thorarchaeota archaeon]
MFSNGNPFELIFGGRRNKPFRYGIIGGTFGPLHDGHKVLLKAGLLVCETLIIGLTNNDMAQKKDKRIIDFDSRFWALKQFMDSITDFRDYQIVPIDNPYGMAVTTEQAEVIICSDEDEVISRVREINDQRRAMKIHELLIFMVPRVRDPKGEIISSTRIRDGELPSEDQLGQKQED